MKILVGSFQCESNTFSTQKATRENFHILYGEDVIKELAGCRLLEKDDIELVPMLYAVSLPSGEVVKKDYLDILDKFLEIASKHKDADGMYLYFHGSMFVEDLGSGEEYFIKSLRKILGNEIPISVACDFHSTVTDSYAASINALSGYRTAPHTDYDETEYRAATALLKILRNGLRTKLAVFRVPVLLADAAQTALDPYVTLLKMLAEADKEPSIVAASLFNGQPWIDSKYTGASIVLTYSDNGEKAIALGQAMADYFEAHKENLHFTVPALSPENMFSALPNMKKPVFISDSGDNTTAGADGKSTFLLEKLMQSGLKKILIAGLYNKEVYDAYCDAPIGSTVACQIPAPDSYSLDLEIKGTLIEKGKILGFVKEDAGEGILVRTENCDIIFGNVRFSFTTPDHFEAMHVIPDNYDYIALKIGYLWPEVAKIAPSTVFCFTPGTSTNDFATLDYKNLKGNYYYIK